MESIIGVKGATPGNNNMTVAQLVNQNRHLQASVTHQACMIRDFEAQLTKLHLVEQSYVDMAGQVQEMLKALDDKVLPTYPTLQSVVDREKANRRNRDHRKREANERRRLSDLQQARIIADKKKEEEDLQQGHDILHCDETTVGWNQWDPDNIDWASVAEVDMAELFQLLDEELAKGCGAGEGSTD